MNNIKVGADPELFFRKNGEIISAIGMIGGSKEEPRVITEQGHAIQEDNVMVEFNIPPSESQEEFRDNINFVKSFLETAADIFECELAIIASAVLQPKYLTSDKAKEFGCEPDYNVHKQCPNPMPQPPKGLRSAGGHIHVGFDNPSQELSEKLVKAMDITLGLESILLDTDDRRKEMYGKAGAFRFKDYGIEYRTLSNFWIQNDELINWAYDNTIKAVELVTSNEIESLYKKYAKDIQEAINTNNKELASKLLEQINKKELVKS